MVKATAFRLKGKAGYTTVAVKMLKGTVEAAPRVAVMHLQSPKGWIKPPDNLAASRGPPEAPPLLFLSGCILGIPPWVTWAKVVPGETE